MLTHFTISVSHHDGCCLVHPTMWSLICHTPSRRMPIGTSYQVEYLFNAIHHHDGCRLVHPTKWGIGQFRVAFMTDSVGESHHVSRSVYRFNSRYQELTNSFTIRLITQMKLIVKHFNYHIFKSICTFVISFQRCTHSI